MSYTCSHLTLFIWQTLANNEDPDKIRHNSGFHHGLHCLLKSKQYSGAEKHHYRAMLIDHPFKYKMDYVIRLVSNFTWKSIGMNRVKIEQDLCGKTAK